ncbi:serine kinase [Ensifer sp. NM-2]|uniref:hypothetical protein n=1 Tax=unclassified Ensifer TaxID=2633371 RepID=UPI00070A96BC|nr:MULTISPECIES: hypothetical protein [unclassified Ensifer]KQW78505.1 serine kinase [Ensifer sp. Root127]PSS61432.1 serine kinase [Ensifer sp. NM-2]
MKFRLSAGASFFLLGERKTIFDEASQQILQLDELSAYLTCLLTDPTSPHELETAVMARGASRARAHASVQNYLAYWSRRNLLEIIFDEEEGQLLDTRKFVFAGTTVSIAFYDQDLRDLILPVFAHNRTNADTLHTAVYDVARLGDRVCISRNRTSGMIVAGSEAAPALKALITDDVLANLGANIALHAALLVRNARGLLICGAPGAGKTTLAMALLAAGFACGGDDIALLDEDGLLVGVPFSPALKQGSWGLLDQMTDAILAAPIHRRLDNKRVRYPKGLCYATQERVPLEAIVLLRRRRNGPVVVTDVEALKVLSELVAGAFTPGRRLALPQFQRLLQMVSGARAVELTYSALDEAVETLSRLHDRQ